MFSVHFIKESSGISHYFWLFGNRMETFCGQSFLLHNNMKCQTLCMSNLVYNKSACQKCNRQCSSILGNKTYRMKQGYKTSDYLIDNYIWTESNRQFYTRQKALAFGIRYSKNRKKNG